VSKKKAIAALLLLAGCAVDPPPQVASFGDFTPSTDYAHYLACPKDYCLATPDELMPLMKLPAEKLRDVVRKVLDAEPRAELLSATNEGLRLVYRQYQPAASAPPDTVTVEIVDVDEGVSAVVLYAQSETPFTDRSEDARRVRRLLAEIDRAVVAAVKH